MNKHIGYSNLDFFRDWFKRFFPNPQAMSLAILLVLGFVIIGTLSDILLPVFASGVIAYLLEGIVSFSQRENLPRFAAVLIVYIAFLAFVSFILIVFIPLLYQQTIELFQQLPSMINLAQEELVKLPELHPTFINEEQVNEIIVAIRKEMIVYGQQILSVSVSSLVSLITLIVYFILVPLLVFFFLKDKHRILLWFVEYLPRDRHLSATVWEEVDIQIGNYIRGKFLEILILGAASFLTFSLMGLNYAALLGLFMGLSVIIPYVGATLITFPVMIVAYTQWGISEEFAYIMLAYTVIQTIDGVVLIPLLFSEAVNIHPVAIIVAILFFGGLWGFWGVFFAIPLATLVQAVLTAWPRLGVAEEEEELEQESIPADSNLIPKPSNDEQLVKKV